VQRSPLPQNIYILSFTHFYGKYIKFGSDDGSKQVAFPKLLVAIKGCSREGKMLATLGDVIFGY